VNHAALNALLALCLGAGAADLLALNLVVLPAARGASAQPLDRQAPPRTPAPPAALPTPRPELALGVQPVPAGAPPRPQPVAILEFDVASPYVDRRATSALGETLARLRDATEIVVIGHADASGPEQLNERLSAQRAAAVARRLLGSGIAEARVRIDARGEREPRQDGNSRRVEIFIGEQP
jgi:OOP family OmpA-OmpF porin